MDQDPWDSRTALGELEEEERHQRVQALLWRHRELLARARAVVAESRRQRAAASEMAVPSAATPGGSTGGGWPFWCQCRVVVASTVSDGVIARVAHRQGGERSRHDARCDEVGTRTTAALQVP